MSAVPSQLSCLLSCNSELIYLVIRHLSDADLNQVGLVNKTWHKLTFRLIRARTKTQCTTYYKSDQEFQNNIFKTGNLKGQRPHLSLCFIKSDLYERYADYLSTTHHLHDGHEEVHQKLRASLPPDCRSLLINSSLFPQDRIHYAPDNCNIDHITFAHHNVRAHTFNLKEGETIPEMADKKNVSFLLMFGFSSAGKLLMDKFYLHFLKHNPDLSVAAVMMRREKDHGDIVLRGVAFYSMVASTVILRTCDDRTLEQIEDRFTQQLAQTKFAMGISPSLVLIFPEHQRRSCPLDVEVARTRWPEASFPGVNVFDVLTPGPDQLLPGVKQWQIPEPPPPVCDKRANGPGLAVLLH